MFDRFELDFLAHILVALTFTDKFAFVPVFRYCSVATLLMVVAW